MDERTRMALQFDRAATDAFQKRLIPAIPLEIVRKLRWAWAAADGRRFTSTWDPRNIPDKGRAVEYAADVPIEAIVARLCLETP